MKTYRVGTFLEEREGRCCLIEAYTRIYSTLWSGCVEFLVEAESGTAAKKKAIIARRSIYVGVPLPDGVRRVGK